MNSKNIIVFAIVLLLSACDYFKAPETKAIIATVNEHILYEEDVATILPENLSEEDSIIFVRAFVDDWAMDKILLDNALFNLPEKEQQRYQAMVEKYKSELFKKAYVDALI